MLVQALILRKQVARLREAGRYKEATPLAEKALELFEKALGPDHPAVAASLHDLSSLYTSQARYSEAEKLSLRALSIWEKARGQENRQAAALRSELASLYKLQGRYREAERLHLHALRTREKLDPEHADVAQSLNNLAAVYTLQERLSEAEPLYLRALRVWEKALGPDHPEVATGLSNLATLYDMQARYSESEPLYLRALRIKEKALGLEHPGLAYTLNRLAGLHENQARYRESESLYQRGLRIREKALGPGHPDVASSLNSLAGLYEARARYRESESLYQRGLRIREKALGPGHPDVASSLNDLAGLRQKQAKYDEAETLYLRALHIDEGLKNPQAATHLGNLADLYQLQGRYDEAERLHLRALRIVENTWGSEHPDVATQLNNLAVLYALQARYGEAETHGVRALRIAKKAWGPEHPNVATNLGNLASVYEDQGKYPVAEPLLLRALSIHEKTLGSDHPNVASSLNSLAALYWKQGRYSEAEPLILRALRIHENALGSEHPDVALDLNSLAELYQTQGRYHEAEPLLVRSRRIHEKTLSPEHPDVAVSLNNLAALYESQGRYNEAEEHFLRALRVHEKALGSEHPRVAGSLHNLAALYASQRRYSEAEEHFQRTLRINEKALGPEHPSVALSLNNLAHLYHSQGRYSEAESLVRRSLKIMENALGPEHSNVAMSLQNLAFLSDSQGRYSEAELLYLRARRMKEEALGAEHPDVAQIVSNLALHYLATGDVERALIHADRAERILDAHLTVTMAAGHERQRHQYMAMHQGDIDIGMTMAVLAPERASELGMRYALRNKGRVQDSMRSMLAAVRDNLDDDGRTLLDRYLNAQTAYAALYLSGPPGATPEERARHDKELADREARKRDIERQLSEKSRSFDGWDRSVSLDDVRAVLPERTALIEWLHYKPFDPKAARRSAPWQAPHYAACVLPHGAAPTCLDLGDAAIIDELALELHRSMSLGLAFEEPSRALYKRVIEPLEPLLQDAQTLYLASDAMLHLTPFAALGYQRDGAMRYLFEDHTLTHVTSGRDLVQKPPPDLERGPAAILGGPRHILPGQENGHRFPALYGAQLEARDIHAMTPGSRLFTDLDVTKAALRALHVPRILHLATHGYFEAADCRGKPVSSDDALAAAGLALTGANACQAEDDTQRSQPGILTAGELAGLDLYGTELVVLSACDTGIGTLNIADDLSSRDEDTRKRIIGIRDGIFGLRRALVLAGVETQLVSLWKVDDAATRAFMVAYYQALAKGAGRAEALRQVQRAMLASDKYAHPNYWASFVLVGNPAPLHNARAKSTSREARGGCASCAASPESPMPAGSLLMLALAVIISVFARRVACPRSIARSRCQHTNSQGG